LSGAWIVAVGGIGIFVGTGVLVGTDVFVGTGVSVCKGVDVDGTDVGAGAHPLITKTVRRTNKRNFDPIDFFMTLSHFVLILR